MKNILVLALWIISATLFAQEFPSGKSIIAKVDKNLLVKTNLTTVKMEIESERVTRTLVIKVWGESYHKAYVEYIAPSHVKGIKMLKLDNKLWIFYPLTKRTVQIAGNMLRESMMGSDFSYEDIMNTRPLLEQYKPDVKGKVILNGRKCWILTLEEFVPNVNYYSQKIWIDAERFVPLKVDLFAKSGRLLKRVSLSNVQKVQGRWLPKTSVVKDMLKDGNGTKMTVQVIKLDTEIPASYFNKAILK